MFPSCTVVYFLDLFSIPEEAFKVFIYDRVEFWNLIYTEFNLIYTHLG